TRPGFLSQAAARSRPVRGCSLSKRSAVTGRSVPAPRDVVLEGIDRRLCGLCRWISSELAQEGGGRRAGERAELVDEVRLVVIAATEGQVAPCRRLRQGRRRSFQIGLALWIAGPLPGVDRGDRSVETHEPCHRLRRQADLLAEPGDQVAVAA